MAVTFGAVGALAGLGLTRDAQLPTVASEPASSNTLASNTTRTVKLLERYFYLKRQTDARYLKIREAANLYIKGTTADRRYIKLSQADARFLKIQDAAGLYIKLTDADARFLKIEDANSKFVKIEDANNNFLKIEDANKTFIKLSDADSRFVHGSAQALTGSSLVGGTKETLLTVPGNLRVEAATNDQGKTAALTLTNLSSVPLTFNQPSAAGAATSSTVQPGGTQGILIGLNQPSTIQVVGSFGDGVPVHTFTFTAFGSGTQVQVLGQALSGTPAGG
jgi:hypothetical protein